MSKINNYIELACLLLLLPLVTVAAVTKETLVVPTESSDNASLAFNKKNKLHPELSDPVLGDQAQIVEWAWSPKYAKRFGIKSQSDGLSDGDLWLVGVKIERKQFKQIQRYTCSIVGLINNKVSIVSPPDNIYLMHPDSAWVGGMPGIVTLSAYTSPQSGSYAPATVAWYKKPKNKSQRNFPERGISAPYKYFYKYFKDDLAYFEWDAGCASFNNPDIFRNEIRFPTRIDGKNDEDSKVNAVMEKSALHYDIPDRVMRLIYPHIREAQDWSSCFMSRVDGQTGDHTLGARKSEQLRSVCNPKPAQEK